MEVHLPTSSNPFPACESMFSPQACLMSFHRSTFRVLVILIQPVRFQLQQNFKIIGSVNYEEHDSRQVIFMITRYECQSEWKTKKVARRTNQSHLYLSKNK